MREACIGDDELFSSFLNRLFNTLSWAMTEFSVSVREMQEMYYKVYLIGLWKISFYSLLLCLIGIQADLIYESLSGNGLSAQEMWCHIWPIMQPCKGIRILYSWNTSSFPIRNWYKLKKADRVDYLYIEPIKWRNRSRSFRTVSNLS